MSLFSKETRKKIFEEELGALYQNNQLTYENYIELKENYHLYYQKTKEASLVPTSIVQVAPKPTPKPVKTKKVLSEQEVRERNITWTLILGVVLLLFGGLIFATNNWQDMRPFAKTLYVAIFSGVFYGMSYVANNVFHIKKTSFAFLVLGSLFLPIVILTAGYFELFGSWFSLQGDGHYLFALVGSIICLPIYFDIAKRHVSRLFVWFSYLTLSLFVGFLLATVQLPIDAFYLGIALYNGLLLFVYHKKKKEEKLQLFMDELPVFAQTNLIISTLLMLMFFEHETFYSFNVILTALLYLVMIFMSKKKEYHFIFSALIVYGIYQMTQHSFLQTIDLVILSLIGYLFIALERVFKEEVYLEKAFRYTSAIISFFAFFYISIQGIFIRLEAPSFLMFFGYVFIALNYLYLTYQTKNKLFAYLSTIFLVIAGHQSSLVIENITGLDPGVLYLFTVGILLYVGLYECNRHPYTKDVKNSAYYIANIVLLYAVIIGAVTEQWWETVLMLGVTSFVYYRTFKHHESHAVKMVTQWLSPLSVLLAFICTYPILIEKSVVYQDAIGFIGHVGFSVILVYLLSYNLKEKPILETVAWTSFVFYALVLFGALPLNDPLMNEPVVQPLLFFAGAGLFTAATLRLKHAPLWLFVSTALIAGFVLLIRNTIPSMYEETASILFVLAGIILLVSQKLFEKLDTKAPPYFFTIANTYLLLQFPTMLLTQFDVWFNYVLFALVALYNLRFAVRPWQKTLFIYFGFGAIIALMNSIAANVPWDTHSGFFNLSVLLVSLIGYVLWCKIGEKWQPYLKWYLIPHAFFFLVITLFDRYYVWAEMTIVFAFIILTLRILHQTNAMKFAVVPLLVLFISVQENDQYIIESEGLRFVFWIGLFFLLKELGKKLTPHLFTWSKEKQIDWFSFTALLFAFATYEANKVFLLEQNILIQLLPGVFVTYWFYSQVKRTEKEVFQRILMTLTSFATMLVYYQLIDHFTLTPLIETELYIFPWIALTWFLSNNTWKNVPIVMEYIHWFVLIFTSCYLVADTLHTTDVMEPILLGVISTTYLLFGFQKQIKSFFFIGVILLFVNLTIQAEPLWSAMPWWSYLLIVGTILIGFASYHEWKKQKGESLFKEGTKHWIERFKDWK